MIMMILKKGGLLRELELKIQATHTIMNDYEKDIKQLEVENERLNYEYCQSYKINIRLCINDDIKYLNSYRQSIMDSLANNNYKLFELNCNLKKQCNIYKFLSKCYYYINM